MSFKYSCIGDNSPENREHCEKVGINRPADTEDSGNVILVYNDDFDIQRCETADSIYDFVDTDLSKVINCIGNPQLFRAVTAIRDDSNYMQWFTNGIHWYLCESTRFKNSSLFDKEYKTQIKDGADYHKATIEELKEHFKIETKYYFINNKMCDLYEPIVVDEELEAKIHDEVHRGVLYCTACGALEFFDCICDSEDE